jgi:hypothetical protein
MFGNLQQQGDKHNSLNFFSGFQDDVEFGRVVDFLDANFGADFTYGDAFDFDSIGSGSFEYDNVSCEFSVEHRQQRCQKKHWTVISHGTGGIDIPAKWRDSLKASCWSKQQHKLVT